MSNVQSEPQAFEHFSALWTNHIGPDFHLSLETAVAVSKEDVSDAWERSYDELRHRLQQLSPQGTLYVVFGIQGSGKTTWINNNGFVRIIRVVASPNSNQQPRSVRMSLHPSLHCRPVEEHDDLEALTALIRSAYAPHAASGLRYWATHQSVEDTAKRLSAGHGFVALQDDRVVATVTLREPEPDSKVPLLREPGTWSFGQFAVAPEHKGKGFGRQIHDFAAAFAHAHGCRRMALHTAQPATALIAMYRSWGYAEVGTCDWRPHTNYMSVLMEKALSSPTA